MSSKTSSLVSRSVPYAVGLLLTPLIFISCENVLSDQDISASYGTEGKITLQFPVRPAAISSEVEKYHVTITSLSDGVPDHHHDVYEPGATVAVDFPAGEALIDVGGFQTEQLYPFDEYRKYFNVASKTVLVEPYRNPEDVANTTISLESVHHPSAAVSGNSIPGGEVTASATIHQSTSDRSQAVITVSSLKSLPLGVSDLSEFRESATFYVVERTDYSSMFVPRPFEVSDASTTSNAVDLAFVVDNSGSMGAEIDGVKDSITTFVESLENEGFDLHLSAVGYVDSTYDTLDFTDDATTFESFVGNMPANGGYEGAYTAISTTFDFAWRNTGQKVLVLITDEDADDEGEITTDNMVSDLQNQNITTHVIHNPSDSENLLPLAEQTGGLKLELPSDGYVDLSSLPISETIQQAFSVSYSTGAANSVHQVGLVMEHPGWLGLKFVDFEVYY